MAKDIKLDDYGDLLMTSGDLENVEDEEEIVQLCKTKILKVYDEDVYEFDGGVNWFDDSNEKVVAMFDFARDDRFKLLVIKGRIMAIPEVTGIPKLNFTTPDGDGQFLVDMDIDTIYSDIPMRVGE